AALGGVVATQAGCIEMALLLALDDDDPPKWEEDWEPPPETTPPAVDVQIADWPPIGPSGAILVNASAEQGIASALISFRNETTLWANGETSFVFTPTGADMGEGLGLLAVTVTGTDGAWTEQTVEDLLVDLTPPVAVLGPTTLPAYDASFDFWMGDAWVVSS